MGGVCHVDTYIGGGMLLSPKDNTLSLFTEDLAYLLRTKCPTVRLDETNPELYFAIF